MKGLFSAAPSPGALRLAVAGMLFGQSLAVILLLSPDGAASPRPIAILLGLLSFGSFVAALIGESGTDPRDRLRSRHRGA